MKKKLFTRPLSLILALVMLLSLLPLTALTVNAEEIVWVTSVSQLRRVLESSGDVVINIDVNLKAKLTGDDHWSYYDSSNDRYYWAMLGDGRKTLNLNGHVIYIDDDFVTTAKYRTETQYNVGTGQTEEVLVFEKNKFAQNACLIGITDTSSLTVNGFGGEIYMGAQIPSDDQMMDSRIVMQRDLFDVIGGSLTINGGTYQAGRRKDKYVGHAFKNDEYWHWEIGNGLIEVYYLVGYGEYAINGTAVNLSRLANVTVNGGDFIGHGFQAGGKNNRNGVFEVKSSFSRLVINDANITGYSGASVIRNDSGSNDTVTVRAGQVRAEAPDWYLWPCGANHNDPADSNCEAIAVGKGSALVEGNAPNNRQSTYTVDYSAANHQPVSSLTDNRIQWVSGGGNTYTIGSDAIVSYQPGDPYFPNFDYNGVQDGSKVNYYWAVSEQQSNGNWSSVTGWVSTGDVHELNLKDLDVSWTKGTKYRIAAKRVENWSTTHQYTITTKTSSSLTFTADRSDISSVSIMIDDPVSATPLVFSPAKAYISNGAQITAIKWYENGSVKSGGNAVAGKSYSVEITVTPTNGAKFITQGFKATINGDNSTYYTSLTSTSATICRNFGYCSNITSTVDVTIEEPVPGEAAEFFATASGKATVASSPSDISVSDAIQWTVSDDGQNYTTMRQGDTFIEGKFYKLYVDVTTYDGYEFALDSSGSSVQPKVTSTVNGKPAQTIKAYDRDPSRTVTVGYDFGQCSGGGRISTVSISGVDQPCLGSTPDYIVFVDGEGYALAPGDRGTTEINGVAWLDENSSYMNSTDTIQAGKSYTVEIELKPEIGCKFSTNNLTAYVNDSLATVVAQTEDYLKLRYTFVWKPVEVSLIEIMDLKLPVVGEHPDYSLTAVDSELYTIKNIQWYHGSIEAGTLIYPEETFEPSDSYGLEIRVSRKMLGQTVISKFVKPITVYLNMAEADYAEILSNSTDVYIYLNYTTDAGGTGGEILLGDADGDGEITVYDATLIQRQLVGIKDAPVYHEEAANVDGDSEVTVYDATYIQRYLVGLDKDGSGSNMFGIGSTR